MSQSPAAPVRSSASASAEPDVTARVLRGARDALVVVGGALVLGGLVSFGQGSLPDWLSSLANSASGFALLTAALLVVVRPPAPLAAVLGAGAFIASNVGYSAVSTWRGFADDPTTWVVVGIVTGPVVGVAAVWLRAAGVRRVLGTSALAGIFVGDGIYGLTTVADTTSPVYWTVIALAGLGLAARAIALSRASAPLVAGVVIGTAGTAALYLGAFSLLGALIA